MRNGEKRKNKYIQLIKITGITGCLVLGLFVVIVLSQLFGKEEPFGQGNQKPDSQQELPLTDDRVLLLDKGDGKVLTLFDLDKKKEYTLKVNGSTYFYDKYEQAISLEQLEPGEIVDIRFHKKREQLFSMKQSAVSWTLTELKNFSLNLQREELTIGQSKYQISKEVKCFLDGELIELSEISTGDSIAVRGIDQQVLSIRVDNGRGHLKLENEEAFVGGWLEVGQNIIRKIEKDLSVSVPEGTYKVTISYRGYMDTKTVEIVRGKETLLDVGDLAESMIKYGKVYFNVTPSDAQVYIDGTLVDTSRLIRMPYGLHQLVAKAEGYDMLTQYFRLEGESASLNVVLQVPEEEEESSEEESSSVSSATSGESTVSSSDDSKESVESSSAESQESTESSGESEATQESQESTEGSKESEATQESQEPTEGSGESQESAEDSKESEETTESINQSETTQESNESVPGGESAGATDATTESLVPVSESDESGSIGTAEESSESSSTGNSAESETIPESTETS